MCTNPKGVSDSGGEPAAMQKMDSRRAFGKIDRDQERGQKKSVRKEKLSKQSL